ncbi:hypothetical protein [Halostagnicola kamekurae]|nr:hypothetical protein [Halostagnicola kamekurae]
MLDARDRIGTRDTQSTRHSAARVAIAVMGWRLGRSTEVLVRASIPD